EPPVAQHQHHPQLLLLLLPVISVACHPCPRAPSSSPPPTTTGVACVVCVRASAWWRFPVHSRPVASRLIGDQHPLDREHFFCRPPVVHIDRVRLVDHSRDYANDP